MNIGFDMSFFGSPFLKGSIGNYANHLIKNMIHTTGPDSFFCFYPNMEHGEQNLRRQIQQFLNENRIDFYLMINPFDFPNQAVSKEWFGDTKLAAILYDLLPYIYEELGPSESSQKESYLHMLEFIKSCDVIITFSESCKKDAVRYAQFDPGKIMAIRGAAGDQYRKTGEADESREKFLSSYGITKPYLICTDKNESYINYRGLLDSFRQVNRYFDRKYQFVVFQEQGKRAAGTADVLRKANEDVICISDVSVRALAQLLNAAEIFVSPSYYEGSGIPVLEAMACGVPVIASRLSASGEVAGDAAVKVDPFSAEEITNAIRYLLSIPSAREAYSRKGLEHVKQYNWGVSADMVLQKFREFLTVPAQQAKPEEQESLKQQKQEEQQELPEQQKLQQLEPALSKDSIDQGNARQAEGIPAKNDAAPDGNITVRLHPNRYKRTVKGKKYVGYVSFNLAELPPGSMISSAQMEIPVNHTMKTVSVHRIKSAWSERSIRRKRPPIRRAPIYKTDIHANKRNKKADYIYWKCTEVVKSWSCDHLTNHGVYISWSPKSHRPSLLVTIGQQ